MEIKLNTCYKIGKFLTNIIHPVYRRTILEGISVSEFAYLKSYYVTKRKENVGLYHSIYPRQTILQLKRINKSLYPDTDIAIFYPIHSLEAKEQFRLCVEDVKIYEDLGVLVPISWQETLSIEYGLL